MEYYYLWKKTPQAASTRPHRRHRRCVLRRIRNNTNKSNSNHKEDGGISSGSEEEPEQTDDSDTNASSDLKCSNCAILAKELHQTGKDRSLLCNECRSYMKRFGEHRPVGEKESQLIKSNNLKMEEEADLSNGKPNLRNRGKGKCAKYELNKDNSKSFDTSSPERNDSNSSELPPFVETKTNGVLHCESVEDTIKNSDLTKKRQLTTNDSLSSVEDVDDDSTEYKIKRHKNENSTESSTTQSNEFNDVDSKVKTKIENSDTEETHEHKDNSPVNDEPVTFSAIKQEIKDDLSIETAENTLETNNKLENTSEKLEFPEVPEPVAKSKDPSSPSVSSADTKVLDKLKVELPSSPKSPQDLSLLSSRDKLAESVPSSISPDASSTIVSTSPIKKEESSFVRSPSNSSASVEPFGPNMAPLPPTMSLIDRFTSLGHMSYPPIPSLHQSDSLTDNKVIPPVLNEPDFKPKDGAIKNETNKSIKNESNRPNRSSPKVVSSTSTFPSLGKLILFILLIITVRNLVPPYTSSALGANDAFLMSQANFNPAHLASPGSERLPFPMMGYPPGFPAGLPGMPPFLHAPWSQYPPARLPLPYMPSANQPTSHSPQSQKSKSPMTSQSGSIHNSPSHFSHLKPFDNYDRRDKDVYSQDPDDDYDSSYLPRGPSPEPKIEDSECHRSQSAMYG